MEEKLICERIRYNQKKEMNNLSCRKSDEIDGWMKKWVGLSTIRWDNKEERNFLNREEKKID